MTFKAGRFVLVIVGEPDPHSNDDGLGYVTSWDTWEESAVAFPIEDGFRLIDTETGREWWPGSKCEWEAART